VKFIVVLSLVLAGCFGHQPVSQRAINKSGVYSDGGDFFSEQRFGVNFFNEQETLERMMAAKRLGFGFIRLTPSKWKSSRPNANLGEFLIGDRAHYQGLYQKDLDELRKILDMADQVGLKVVLTFLSVPGLMWRQHNHGRLDCRLWRDEALHEQVQDFFADISVAVLKHPAVVAINPLNEPAPEHCATKAPDWADTQGFSAWHRQNQNTASDLNILYKKIHKSIRKFHRTIPIIFGASNYTSGAALPYLTPFSDPHVLYSFHMYEPFFYTYQKKPKLSYPGDIPSGEYGATVKRWDKQALVSFLAPIRNWQEQHKIPHHRIFVGEFGVDRAAPSAVNYLSDVMDIFNEQGWSFALYTFRETAFTKFDYEVGFGKPGWKYWQAIEAGHDPNFRLFKSNELIETILSKIGPQREAIKPTMGFNSWNWFGKNINETIVEETIVAMANQGFKKAGYDYVVIDGGWADDNLDKEGRLLPHPQKFPRGIKRLSDLAHAHGLKLGLHVSAGTHNCGGKPVGSLGREQLHIEQLNQWQIDYIKLDQCELDNTEDWPKQQKKTVFQTWHDLIKNNHRPIVLSMSAYKFHDWYPQFGAFGRTTMDLRPKIFGGAVFNRDYTGVFLSVMEAAEINNRHHAKAGRSYWNDPDMLVVGDPNLTHHQQRTHFALWAMMNAPLMLGLDIRVIDEETKRLILDPEIIALDQDPYQQGYRIKKTADLEIWRKFLKNGDTAILAINLNKEKSQPALINDYEAEMAGEFQVKDLFLKKSLGRFSNHFKTEIGPDQSKLLLFTQSLAQ